MSAVINKIEKSGEICFGKMERSSCNRIPAIKDKNTKYKIKITPVCCKAKTKMMVVTIDYMLYHLCNIGNRYRAGLAEGVSGSPPLLLVLIKKIMMMKKMRLMIRIMKKMVMTMLIVVMSAICEHLFLLIIPWRQQ